MQLIDWLKNKGLVIAVYLLIAFILIDTGVIFSLKGRINTYNELTARVQVIGSKTEFLLKNATTLDLSVRDYLIRQNPVVLTQFQESLTQVKTSYDTLKYNLEAQELNASLIQALAAEVRPAIDAYQSLFSAIRQGDSTQISNQFNALPHITSKAETFANNLRQLEKNAIDQRASINQWLIGAVVMQLIFLLSIPLLVYLSIRLNRQEKYLIDLNREIEESNRKYVFNPMDEVSYEDAAEIKTRLLNNLKQAANFIQHISNGNYEIRWEGLNDANREANKENIAGELIRMREQMKHVKEQDRVRIWTTEGLSKFGEIIRKQQDDFNALSDSLISNVVKYVGAKVGGLFIVEQEGEESEPYLSLRACYAYDRKKFIVKKVDIGQGLVGQAYLEGHTIYLKKVPKDYMAITSGLGEANPSSLLVVPLKANDKIEGILELASLKEFQPYEIEFLEKLGETLASSVISIRTAERTKALLQTSQEQSEEMRAQEEEMRQNMEELEATQEQMHRQVSELNLLKENLEKEKYLFNALMDNIPDSIYFKDKQSKLIRLSKYMMTHFGLPMEELIGKSDFDFQDEAHAREAFDDEMNIMKTRVPKIDYVEKEVKADGSVVWVSTTKMPLENASGEVVGTFGISRNVSTLKQLEIDVLEKDRLLKEEEKVYEEKIRSLENELKIKEEQLQKLTRK
jgi:PAS domain S-box-containing protein